MKHTITIGWTDELVEQVPFDVILSAIKQQMLDKMKEAGAIFIS